MRYEMPPIEQLVYEVDTIYLKNPVIIVDDNNRWIIDASQRPLNDKMIESYLTDSVRYLSVSTYNFYPPYPIGSEKCMKFLKEPPKFCDCRKVLRPEESSKKYEVYDYIDQPKGFALFLVNARYYVNSVPNLDEEVWIDNIVKDYTMSYVPVLMPLGCCDYNREREQEP